MIKTKMMKKALMKKITFLSFLLVMSVASWAELPSWGMTENQYKLPNFSNKMSDIGGQAYKKNWLLKVTAPSEWHGSIRGALTQAGDRDVQITFKDSLYKSISISAVPGAKTAKISPSTSNGATIQKQVVIDKPKIDTSIEAPDFGDTDFKNNTADLLENISAMEMTVPKSLVKPSNPEAVVVDAPKVTPKPEAVEVPKVETQVAVKTTQVAETPVVSTPTEALAEAPVVSTSAEALDQPQTESAVILSVVQSDEQIENTKETLRKRHARSKRVEKLLSYKNIKSKDELFIDGSVVLVKRFINQGVVLYYWMREPYDPTLHKLVAKGSEKFQKDSEAPIGESPAATAVVEDEEVQTTSLDFVAVDTSVVDKDDLRSNFIRNKRVDYTISASRLKADDVLYVQNQTVLVVRPITRSQSTFYWLVGDTTISREVDRKGDSMFVIK